MKTRGSFNFDFIFAVKRSSLELKNRRFTYSEVKDMTNNFQVVLGKGGFGVVCQGFLNNQQVAVKVLSQSSTQGYKEFKTEVLNYTKPFPNFSGNHAFMNHIPFYILDF